KMMDREAKRARKLEMDSTAERERLSRAAHVRPFVTQLKLVGLSVDVRLEEGRRLPTVKEMKDFATRFGLSNVSLSDPKPKLWASILEVLQLTIAPDSALDPSF